MRSCRAANSSPSEWAASPDAVPRTSEMPAFVRKPLVLTSREREVLQLLAEGRANKEVANALGITTKTAETHRARIMAKLEVHSMSELVRYAIRNHIIDPVVLLELDLPAERQCTRPTESTVLLAGSASVKNLAA